MNSTPSRPLLTHVVQSLLLVLIGTLFAVNSAIANPASTSPASTNPASTSPTSTSASAPTTDAATPPQAQKWHTDLETAQSAALETGQPILVDLWADWCGWCKRLEREVFPDPVFVEYTQKFVLLRLNADSDDGADIQARYRTYSLPTALLLSPRLVEMGRVEGFARAKDYVSLLDTQLYRWRQAQERRAWQADSDDPRILLQLARELHEMRDGTGAAAVYERLLAAPTVSTPKSSSSADALPEEAWLYLMLADAQRLAGEYKTALTTLERGQRQAKSENNSELLQAVDLLRIQIAHDRHDCSAARSALETFLSTYPRSPHRRQARDSLRALEQGRTDCS